MTIIETKTDETAPSMPSIKPINISSLISPIPMPFFTITAHSTHTMRKAKLTIISVIKFANHTSLHVAISNNVIPIHNTIPGIINLLGIRNSL